MRCFIENSRDEAERKKIKEMDIIKASKINLNFKNIEYKRLETDIYNPFLNHI